MSVIKYSAFSLNIDGILNFASEILYSMFQNFKFAWIFYIWFSGKLHDIRYIKYCHKGKLKEQYGLFLPVKMFHPEKIVAILFVFHAVDCHKGGYRGRRPTAMIPTGFRRDNGPCVCNAPKPTAWRRGHMHRPGHHGSRGPRPTGHHGHMGPRPSGHHGHMGPEHRGHHSPRPTGPWHYMSKAASSIRPCVCRKQSGNCDWHVKVFNLSPHLQCNLSNQEILTNQFAWLFFGHALIKDVNYRVRYQRYIQGEGAFLD